MKIIKGKENGSIRNNYIYLSENIINEFSLYDNKDKVIKLMNIRNSTTIYTQWNGGMINNKEDCFEFSSPFCKDKPITEEYFYIELIEGEYINQLSLIPLNHNDYISIDSYSDFFEEDFLNQIAIVYKNEIIPFYLPFDNKVCFLRANIDKLFGKLCDDCEINIQYVPPKEKKEAIADGKERIIKIDSFKKSIDDLFTINKEIFYICLKEEKETIWRYCDEKSIHGSNKNISFPYQKGLWIGKEIANDINSISLPNFVILNCAFFINDSLSYKQCDIDEIIKDRTLYYKYLQSEIKIQFFSKDNSVNNFKAFLVSLKPFVFTNNFIYQFENYIVSIQLANKQEYSTNYKGEFPIILDDNINISLCKIEFSNDLYLKFSYSLLSKNKRYLSLNNIEEKNINKELITFHKKEIIDMYRTYN